MSRVAAPPPMPRPGHLRQEPTRRNLPVPFLLQRPHQRPSRRVGPAVADPTLLGLGVEGAESFTTNRVAEVAGISVGSLYQYFENKEMLIAGTIERGIMDSAAIVGDALSKNPNAPAFDVLYAAAHAVAEGLKPFRQLLTHAFAVTPLARDTGVITHLETRITTVIRLWICARPDLGDYASNDAISLYTS